MSVNTALFRIYRPIIAWFVAILTTVELVAVTGILKSAGVLRFSFWMVIAGNGLKYWTLVVGIMLISLNMRQFVTNGVTRRRYFEGAAVFTLIVALGFTLAVVLGHTLESVLVGAFSHRGPDYPVVTAAIALRDIGHLLPEAVAWPLSGAIVSVGFYRYPAWVGLIVMMFGAVPALVADVLLSVSEVGVTPHWVPYPVALLLSLAASALGVAGLWFMTRDVPIRRTAG